MLDEIGTLPPMTLGNVATAPASINDRELAV
jgi:hypothetical protein